MPMLPSGRHVAITATLLDDLIAQTRTGFAIEKLMSIEEPDDILAYMTLLDLIPTEDVPGNEMPATHHSAPIPANLSSVETGIRMNDAAALALHLSEADLRALQTFMASEPVRAQMQAWLNGAKNEQHRLGQNGGLAGEILAAWWKAGVYPAQEEGWSDEDTAPLPDGRQPWEWDFYDALAAYLRIAERTRQGLEILPGWLHRADGYLSVAYKHLAGLAGHGFADSDTPRELGARLRNENLLDNAPMLSAKWLQDQLIVECNVLYDTDGFDDMRPILPRDADIVELVALSGASKR